MLTVFAYKTYERAYRQYVSTMRPFYANSALISYVANGLRSETFRTTEERSSIRLKIHHGDKLRASLPIEIGLVTSYLRVTL
jgi:hypothetical protein